MPAKTIKIDSEAYEALVRLRREDQSFSQVIKEHLAPRRGRDLQRVLEHVSLSEETLDTVDELIESREKNPARFPEL